MPRAIGEEAAARLIDDIQIERLTRRWRCDDLLETIDDDDVGEEAAAPESVSRAS